MAIEGDLKDMSLINLVQFSCLDGRNTALFLTRRGEEGVIFFDRGELIHATTGPLEGDEAIYQLLDWIEGTFRVTNYVTIPRRTITTSWNHLVLEGMRQIDERRRGATKHSEKHRVLNETEIEQDSSLENDLILLLSRIEHSRAQITEKKSQKQPALALEILTEIVNHVAAFTEEHLYMDVLAEALTYAMDENPGAHLLQIEDNRLSGKTKVLYSKWKGDPMSRQKTFHQVGYCMIKVLETFFSFITNYFRSSSMSDQWRLTCSDFISDLTHAVEKVQF